MPTRGRHDRILGAIVGNGDKRLSGESRVVDTTDAQSCDAKKRGAVAAYFLDRFGCPSETV